MQVIHLLGLIAGLALLSTGYGEDDKHRKKSTATITPTPYTPKPPATPSTPQKPKSTHSERNSEYTREPYRPRTERDYEPWRTNRSSPPAKSTKSTTPKTQAAKTTAKPAEAARDPALKRCDDLKRRMEQLVREEGFGGDAARQQRIAAEKRSLYQEELRFGCI